jgi:membrane protein DedA with SNARE-associated domain
MKLQALKLISAISVFLTMVLGSPSVNAAHYTFSQGGFYGYGSFVGIITGSFDGVDSIPDGMLSSKEVTKFAIHFSGSETFTSLNNRPGSFLQELLYDIHSNTLALRFGQSADFFDPNDPTVTEILLYDAGFVYNPGTVNLFHIHNSLSYSTEEPVVVTTPLPGALILFATGIASLLGLVRRKFTPATSLFLPTLKTHEGRGLEPRSAERINMKPQVLKLISAISVCLLMVLGSPSVNAAHYIFSQGGFTGGGLVTGSFDGEDTTPDGIISLPEVSSFSIHFSGNTRFDLFNRALLSVGLRELQLPGNTLQLQYNLLNNALSIFVQYDLTKSGKNGFSNFIIALLLYGSDPGAAGLQAVTGGKIPVDESLYFGTPNKISVTEGNFVTTPLPGALILFATGIASLLGLVRHKTIPVTSLFLPS